MRVSWIIGKKKNFKKNWQRCKFFKIRPPILVNCEHQWPPIKQTKSRHDGSASWKSNVVKRKSNFLLQNCTSYDRCTYNLTAPFCFNEHGVWADDDSIIETSLVRSVFFFGYKTVHVVVQTLLIPSKQHCSIKCSLNFFWFFFVFQNILSNTVTL